MLCDIATDGRAWPSTPDDGRNGSRAREYQNSGPCCKFRFMNRVASMRTAEPILNWVASMRTAEPIWLARLQVEVDLVVCRGGSS
jgi:hypothetical protein